MRRALAAREFTPITSAIEFVFVEITLRRRDVFVHWLVGIFFLEGPVDRVHPLSAPLFIMLVIPEGDSTLRRAFIFGPAVFIPLAATLLAEVVITAKLFVDSREVIVKNEHIWSLVVVGTIALASWSAFAEATWLLPLTPRVFLMYVLGRTGTREGVPVRLWVTNRTKSFAMVIRALRIRAIAKHIATNVVPQLLIRYGTFVLVWLPRSCILATVVSYSCAEIHALLKERGWSLHCDLVPQDSINAIHSHTEFTPGPAEPTPLRASTTRHHQDSPHSR